MDRLWVIEARITGGPPVVSLSTLVRGGIRQHASDHDGVSLSTLMRERCYADEEGEGCLRCGWRFNGACSNLSPLYRRVQGAVLKAGLVNQMMSPLSCRCYADVEGKVCARGD